MLSPRSLALLVPFLLGGCINMVIGVEGHSALGEAGYARSYNDEAGTGATYGTVTPVRPGLAGGFGFGTGNGTTYALVRLHGSALGAVEAEARDAEGTVREQFRLEIEEGGVVVEAGRSDGLFGALGVMQREATGFVNDVAGGSVAGTSRGYVGRVEAGLNFGQPNGVFSLYAGANVPLSGGDPVLPSAYAMENGRRVFGPDPLRAARFGVFAGLRMGLFVGCACP